MTRIRASCPDCGEVDLYPDDVVLRVVRSADGELTEDSSYRFSCPDCAGVVTKPADERIADLLTTGGVTIEELGGAPRTDRGHPETPPTGPPLTLDDLLDLHLLLETDSWFDALLTVSR